MPPTDNSTDTDSSDDTDTRDDGHQSESETETQSGDSQFELDVESVLEESTTPDDTDETAATESQPSNDSLSSSFDPNDRVSSPVPSQDSGGTAGGPEDGSQDRESNASTEQISCAPVSDESPPLESDTTTRQAFRDWADKQDQTRNAQDGYGARRNDPRTRREDDQISPHTLLGCHRQHRYREEAVPGERRPPRGVFSIGHFGEDLIREFLESRTTSRFTIRNSLSVSVTVSLPKGSDATLSGETDPVVVALDGTPQRLFEVKTTGNTRYVEDAPKSGHKAQAFAYALGLAEQFDFDDPPPITVVYWDKKSGEAIFHDLTFDPQWWVETVLPWIQTHVRTRRNRAIGETIDIDGDQGWRCRYCEFRERCGNPDTGRGQVGHMNDAIQGTLEDQPARGFVPLLKYPEAQVVNHLQAYDDVQLTPTVALAYPALTTSPPFQDVPVPRRMLDRYGEVPRRPALGVVCHENPDHFAASFETVASNWDGDVHSPPTCPVCEQEDGKESILRGPLPEELHMGEFGRN